MLSVISDSTKTRYPEENRRVFLAAACRPHGRHERLDLSDQRVGVEGLRQKAASITIRGALAYPDIKMMGGSAIASLSRLPTPPRHARHGDIAQDQPDARPEPSIALASSPS